MSVSVDLDPTQLAAVEHACASQFSIITGGAGTGKTTIIKEICERLGSRATVYLCAFAGKAAARLKEATGRETATIHRMLQYNGRGFGLDTLDGKSVIVDEASMVDSELMAEIIKREPERLILVGDDAQLLPVGKGQPFHDILKLRPDIVYKLTKCYRNTEAVFKAATDIRTGGVPRISDRSDNEIWNILQTGRDVATHKAIIRKVRDGFFDFQQDIILCPKNGDESAPATVRGLNAEIAGILYPREAHEKFVAGDRVMNTKNNPDKDIWNGTTGTVLNVDMDGSVSIKLDEDVIDWKRSESGRPTYKDQVKLTKKEAKDLVLAYAISVHKAQGSQYRRVCFVCLGRDSYALLDRSLIYTAVTRTKNECYIVGERRAFFDGISKVREKATVLQHLAAGEVA